MAVRNGGTAVSVAVRVTPAYAAESTTGVPARTACTVTGNVAAVAPAGTVTVAATVTTAVLARASATAAPPVGAGPVSVTVPVALLPPRRLVGERVRVSSVAACTPNGVDQAPPP